MAIKDLRRKHKLFYTPGACSLAPHIVLEEIGKPYELELVSGNQTPTPEALAVNPKWRVPALTGVPEQIGCAEQVLTEAPAIMVYLARSNPDSGLLPIDPAREARCLEWLSWLSSNVHALSYGQIWRPARFIAAQEGAASVITRGQQNVRQQYDEIEKQLADGRSWAVSGGYSLVEPYLLVFYHWGNKIGLNMRTLYPAWTRLSEKTLERPAVRQVLMQENIALF
jgi:glutathione S-transferase